MNKTIKKQDELKKWIKKLGMTQKYFAEQYFTDEYNRWNEEEIKEFYEKFRGHLKRKTTPIEKIDIYLNYLYEMDEFKKKCYVKPVYIESDLFSKDFSEKMRNISKMIHEGITNTK